MVESAGIPLVYVNRGPDQKKLPENVAVVVSDSVVAGRLQMQALADCMGDKGNVAIMMGELASNATAERTAGNKEIIAKYPEIKVVEEQTANWSAQPGHQPDDQLDRDRHEDRRCRREQRRNGDWRPDRP